MRATSLRSVLTNYTALQLLWERAKNSTSNPTIKGRIIGVESQFKTFSFYFGVHLAELQTDNLSNTLQPTSVSAIEGANMASMTVKMLQVICSLLGSYA